MKSIKVDSWKEASQEGVENEVNLIQLLSVLVSNKKPADIPKGIDKFRLFNRIGKAFDKAMKTKTLELEEGDYTFLKDTIEKEVPCTWGMNKEISGAVEAFLNAETIER